MSRLDWKRGFWRAWIAGTGCWLVFITITGVLKLYERVESGRFSIEDAVAGVLYLVGPPLFVLGVGSLVAWVMRGFNGSE